MTPDCMLYQSYKLQHMNPENYTRRAYIGETSMRQRIRKLEEKCEKLNGERMPVQELLEEIRQAMQMEMLKQPAEDYLGWLADSKAIISKEKKKAQLLEDVYKRQALYIDGCAACNSGWCDCQRSAGGYDDMIVRCGKMSRENVITVSYTHLDVYKREI